MHSLNLSFLKCTTQQSSRAVHGKYPWYAHTTANISRICAPTEFGGAGFPSWYALQGVGQVKFFLKHRGTKSMISKVLRIDLAWSQWQAGIGSSILHDVKTSLPWLECRWLRSLQDFLGHCGGRLRIDDPFVIPHERHGNIYVMEYAQQSCLFNPTKLTLTNYCRLYLHVTTVPELINAGGTAILPHSFNAAGPLGSIRTTTSRDDDARLTIRLGKGGSDYVENFAPITVLLLCLFLSDTGNSRRQNKFSDVKATIFQGFCRFSTTGMTIHMGNATP